VSGTIATLQEINVAVEGDLVAIYIHGAGCLKMPPDAAHKFARNLVGAANEIEQRPSWPPKLMRK